MVSEAAFDCEDGDRVSVVGAVGGKPGEAGVVICAGDAKTGQASSAAMLPAVARQVAAAIIAAADEVERVAATGARLS